MAACTTPLRRLRPATAASTAAITTYANNVAPDFIVKSAVDYPLFHGELGGIARFLRDYYYPVANITETAHATYNGAAGYTYGRTYTSHTSDAGGAFAVGAGLHWRTRHLSRG